MERLKILSLSQKGFRKKLQAQTLWIKDQKYESKPKAPVSVKVLLFMSLVYPQI